MSCELVLNRKTLNYLRETVIAFVKPYHMHWLILVDLGDVMKVSDDLKKVSDGLGKV